MKTRRLLLAALAIVAGSTALLPLARSRPTTHAVTEAPLGTPTDAATLESTLDEPGPIEVETIVGADWNVPRGGLINLDHPEAKRAGLTDGPEPIVVQFHALRHPQRGLFLVDTGVERAFRDAPDQALIGGIVGRIMNVGALTVRTATADWLAGRAVQGVFLTHLHLDHLTGMRDVPNDAQIFVGPGEAHGAASFEHRFVRGYTDQALAGKDALREWRYASSGDDTLPGVIDVFGDRSLFAIAVPGHTPGSTAYLARTPRGPILMTGDACHTAWGWEHGVEPGDFSEDKAESARSLAALRALVARHPRIDVRLGHQALAAR
jgi:glyoxylase-like metal-dependent hydrolase (beta-lactamase superfamily II)